MKRNVIISTLSTVLLFAMGVGSASAVTLQQVKDRGYARVAVANEIPYGYVGAEGKPEGPGPLVAEHVLKQLGIDDIQWSVTAFGSLIPGLKANRFDMTAAEMAILPQRCQQVIYSEPNTTYGEGLMVKHGNPKNLHGYADFAKMSNAKVAIMAGADQLDMLHKLGVSDSQMVTIQNNADAISTVATGRADAYAATGLTAAQLAQKSDKVQLVDNFDDPVIDGKPVRSWGGFTFNKDSEDFRDAFNKELVKFKKTDEWRNILAKYGFSSTDINQSLKKTTEELCSAE